MWNLLFIFWCNNESNLAFVFAKLQSSTKCSSTKYFFAAKRQIIKLLESKILVFAFSNSCLKQRDSFRPKQLCIR